MAKSILWWIKSQDGTLSSSYKCDDEDKIKWDWGMVEKKFNISKKLQKRCWQIKLLWGQWTGGIFN